MIECISSYSSNHGSWEPGDVIEDAQLIEWLLNDSPDSFRRIDSTTNRALDAAPMDRMQRTRNKRAPKDQTMTSANFGATRKKSDT